jgi:hypothetical protein
VEQLADKRIFTAVSSSCDTGCTFVITARARKQIYWTKVPFDAVVCREGDSAEDVVTVVNDFPHLRHK